MKTPTLLTALPVNGGMYALDPVTGARYHLVPLADAAPPPKAVPERFQRRDPQRQTCKACGLPSEVCFHVPDEVWAAAVPAHLRDSVVCLTCFDLFASAAKVDYASSVTREAYFVGARGTLIFNVAKGVDTPGDAA